MSLLELSLEKRFIAKLQNAGDDVDGHHDGDVDIADAQISRAQATAFEADSRKDRYSPMASHIRRCLRSEKKLQLKVPPHSMQ